MGQKGQRSGRTRPENRDELLVLARRGERVTSAYRYAVKKTVLKLAGSRHSFIITSP
ncbi:hypothetical protein CSC34_6185 [Pseudomonas aeruginosa]|nr:hypothetical protein CSC34_6185 [Pseudomonas aeruginosa]